MNEKYSCPIFGSTAVDRVEDTDRKGRVIYKIQCPECGYNREPVD